MSHYATIVTFVACLCVVSGCATSHTPATGRAVERVSVPATRHTGSRPARATPDAGSRIARAALDVLGTPYRYGGNNADGFDCSGLVQYAHSQAGISIPRTIATQFKAAKNDLRSLRVGDVLFFKIKGRVSHNGIYLGDERFIHAPATGKNVTISRTDNPYFRKRLAGVRRFH